MSRGAANDTTRESVEALVGKLGKDVFYGEERIHKMRKHNPMHLDAIVTLRALLSELDAARTALAAAEAREKALLDMISASKEPSGIAVSESVFEMHRAALKKGEGQ